MVLELRTRGFRGEEPEIPAPTTHHTPPQTPAQPPPPPRGLQYNTWMHSYQRAKSTQASRWTRPQQQAGYQLKTDFVYFRFQKQHVSQVCGEAGTKKMRELADFHRLFADAELASKSAKYQEALDIQDRLIEEGRQKIEKGDDSAEL